MAGITNDGFEPKTQAEILAEIEQEQRAEVDPNWDTSSDQPQGQVNAIMARQLTQCWELLAVVYGQFDRDKAEGEALDGLGKLSGTERRSASSSVVTASVDLDSGTTLVSGTHYASVDGDPDNRWTPVENYTAASSGVQPVEFQAENTGPIAALSGTITVIATPVTGWQSITNAQDATLGRTVDGDPLYRQRQEEGVAETGSATLAAIKADLLDLSGIESVKMFENDTNAVDGNGLPPKSFEALVFDGDVPAVSDDVIAQRILDSKAAGIQAFGSSSGNAVDSEGDTVAIPFTRPTGRDVYIDFTLTVDPSIYAGDAAVQALVAQEASEKFAPGDDVIAKIVECMPFQVAGVLDVTGFGIDFSVAPVATANLAIAPREHARFDTSRITVSS